MYSHGVNQFDINFLNHADRKLFNIIIKNRFI